MDEGNQHCFYDIYWRSPDNAPPEHDPDTRKRLRFLFDTLNRAGSKNKLILDAGCGTGLVTHKVHKAGHKVLGIDISPKAIAEARSRYPETQFVQGALDTKWPFDNEEFDVIYSFEVIEHILHTLRYVSEMNRTLKRGGLLVLTTPFHGLVKNLLTVMFAFDCHFCNIRSGHIRFFSNKSLENILEEFGFQVLYWRYYGRLWPIPKGVYVVAQKVHEIENKENEELRCIQK